MKFALVNEIKTAAFKKGKGLCQDCEGDVHAKCGAVKIWHWAHKAIPRNCWSKGETEWHRNWKNYFSELVQEVRMKDAVTGEQHIADVRFPGGTVLEFQNSFLTLEERDSRENFYGDLIWIVNIGKYLTKFELGHPLPSSKSDFDKTIDFVINFKSPKYIQSALWIDKKISPLTVNRISRDMVDHVLESHDFEHILIPKASLNTWFTSKKRVVFDFGDENHLWELIRRHPNHTQGYAVREISKTDFIEELRSLEIPF